MGTERQSEDASAELVIYGDGVSIEEIFSIRLHISKCVLTQNFWLKTFEQSFAAAGQEVSIEVPSEVPSDGTCILRSLLLCKCLIWNFFFLI